MRLHVSRLLLLMVMLAAPALGDDAIEGVQAAALDQPRIYLNLHRIANGQPLRTDGTEPASAVEAFLDTGASGIMLSDDTVKKLRIRPEPGVVFEDVGVGGSEAFGVTEPLLVSVAQYPKFEPETADFSKPIGPFRMQIKPGGGVLEMIAPGLDVLGMPALAGRVVVLDTRPLKDFDKIKTSLVEPGDRSIPKTSRNVQLTGVSFAKFTRVRPAGAAGPNLCPNPMIGPDPFKPGDTRKPVIVRHGGNEIRGTFLLDTGAAASIISSKLATDLGLRIGPGGALENVPRDRQFQLAIGGLGGAKQVAGTFFERLEIPTREGPPIVYAKAPLLVHDITVVDAEGKPFTIDGVLGMNYLVASAEITGGLLPDVGRLVGGPWKVVVIDLKQGILGLEPQ